MIWISADRVGGLERPPRYHQRPVEGPAAVSARWCGYIGTARSVGDVAQLHAILHQCCLERERAAERKDHQIVAPVLLQDRSGSSIKLAVLETPR